MVHKFIKIALCTIFMLPLFSKAQIHISDKVKFLALGDSYTIGESVDSNLRWPVQLVDSLRAKGLDCYEPKIIAMTGWRTDNLRAAIERAGLTKTYNLVSLLIGVNNYYQGRTIENYRSEFENLLTTAIDLAGGDKSRVFVVSIPDYGYTPFGKNSQTTITAGIDEFNAANKAITEKKGVAYINITDISRQDLSRPDLVALDGLHPSGKMYTEWVRAILNNLKVNE